MKIVKQNIIDGNSEFISEVIRGNNIAVEQFYKSIINFIKSAIKKLDFQFQVNEIDSLCHDLFVKIYFKLPKYNPNKNLHSWIYTVVKNSLIDEKRKEKTQRLIRIENTLEYSHNDVLNKFFGKTSPSPEELYLKKEKISELSILLNQLSKKNKELVIGFYLEGKSLKELAKELNVSTNSISIRLLRIKQNLKKIYFHKYGKIT